MYKITYSKRFKKDLQKLAKSGKFDTKRFDSVVDLLASGKKLPENYKDHQLQGRLLGLRECHVCPDMLLIYTIFEDIMVLHMIRIGSHSQLFG